MRSVRRIVTGTRPDGRSYIESDTQFPAVPSDSPIRVGVWKTDSLPVRNDGPDPVPNGVIEKTAPEQRGGTVFRITEIPPDGSLSEMRADELVRRGVHVTADRSARHPGFHMTDTLDYAICLEGEVWAVMDENETLMRAGDILVQRGTYHAWSNRSDRICRMAFILIDAEALA
jgi:quercetin dioxygenase-like cupin family protein